MTVGVYGLGRFGLFWARLLSGRFEVKAYSRTKRDELPAGVTWAGEDDVCACDALFFCVAISAFEDVLGAVRGKVKPPTVVFDTCSVKVFPAGLMERLLDPGVRIIATHPMFGPDSGSAGVAGLPIVMYPVRADRETAGFWKDYFLSLGLQYIEMDPAAHDREAAFTQGITHYMGRVLADLSLKKSPIATLGYRKLLEIVEQTCNDPWQLFLDIQRYNPYTKDMRVNLHRSLEKIYKILDDESK
ncbi:MAG: prephenate dehydrogenase/arogenate dehydrogenase family protein [Spirochaetales bacterium]|nr:prephenate dehydrogenase/arogenate dehydrogenase family protein [Spirochaetales bacterium]